MRNIIIVICIGYIITILFLLSSLIPISEILRACSSNQICNNTCYSSCDEEIYNKFACVNDVGTCSYLFENDTIEYSNRPFISKQIDNIYMSKEIINELNDKFKNSTNEFEVCLYGKDYKESYIINNIYEPPFYSASKDSISSYNCVGNYLGTVHSHPNGVCMPSLLNPYSYNTDSDIKAWSQGDGTNISGIMCGNNKIVIYKKNNYNYDKFISLIVVNNSFEENITLKINDVCPINTNMCGDDCFSFCDGVFKCEYGIVGVCTMN